MCCAAGRGLCRGGVRLAVFGAGEAAVFVGVETVEFGAGRGGLVIEIFGAGDLAVAVAVESAEAGGA